MGVVHGVMWIGGQGGSGACGHWDRGSGWEWCVGVIWIGGQGGCRCVGSM